MYPRRHANSVPPRSKLIKQRKHNSFITHPKNHRFKGSHSATLLRLPGEYHATLQDVLSGIKKSPLGDLNKTIAILIPTSISNADPHATFLLHPATFDPQKYQIRTPKNKPIARNPLPRACSFFDALRAFLHRRPSGTDFAGHVIRMSKSIG